MIRAVLFAMGLVTGPFHVGIDFESPPHSVQISLDGEPVADISRPPWQAWIELGDELAPRRLEVVSFDRDGRELDRETRWLNSPEPRLRRDATPVAVLLDRPKETPDEIASWFEVDGSRAEVLDVENPGAELWIVRDPRLMAELETAAARVLADALELPGVTALLDGDTLRSGRERTLEHLESNTSAAFIMNRHRFPTAWRQWRDLLPLEQDTEIYFVSPWGAPVSQVETPRQIFTTTSPVDARANGVLLHLFTTRPLGRWYRLVDAVALAGLEAATGDRRRAVLVLTSDTGKSDLSLHDAPTVRRFLGKLGVPLRVWSFEYGVEASAKPWGPAARPIQAPLTGAAEPLSAAHQDLVATLDRQRIVWIAGRHLLDDVRLSDAARGLRLAHDADPDVAP